MLQKLWPEEVPEYLPVRATDGCSRRQHPGCVHHIKPLIAPQVHLNVNRQIYWLSPVGVFFD